MRKIFYLTVFTVVMNFFGANAQKQTTAYLGKISPVVKKQINQALMSYYGLKDAFVESNVKKIDAKSENFRKSFELIDVAQMSEVQSQYFLSEKAIIQKYIDALHQSPNTKQKRQHFNEISLAFYRIVKAFEANQYEAHLQYCWMAQEGDVKDGYWISPDKKIVNPYIPETMLHCGKVAESF